MRNSLIGTKNSITIDKIIILFIVCSMFLLNILMNFSNKLFINIEAILVMYISLYMTITFRKNIMAFVMFIMILYFNYSIIFSRYLYIAYNYYSEFYINVDDRIYGIGIMILLVFMTAIYYFKNNKYKIRIYKKNYYTAEDTNILIVLLMIIILLFINIVGFDHGSYGQRGSTSALYEYSGIFFILAYYYCGKSEISSLLKIMISIIAIGFSIQGFIYGERISGLQFLIIFFAFMLSHKMTYKSICIISLVGLIVMMGIGTYRGSYDSEGITLKLIINALSDRMFTFNGADLAYYTSLTFVMVHDIDSIMNKIGLFLKFILSIFLGSSSVKNSFLAEYTRKYYYHWYGGIYPYVFYFYLGWIGTIVSSFFAGKIINTIYSIDCEFKSYYKLLKIYMIAILPRWYMYSPQILFRGILLFTIVTFAIRMIDVITSRKLNVLN